MKPTIQDSQNAFHIIGQLASLVATPNVSIQNIEIANIEIENLLHKIIKPVISDMTMSASGLIVK